MAFLGLVLAATLGRGPASPPLLWLHPSGKLFIAGQQTTGRLNPGAKVVKTPVGLGLDFAAGKSGFLIPDYPILHLTHSITVAAWIYLRSYTPNPVGAQILFRGDDRSGLDPYHLTVANDGSVVFAIDSADGTQAQARVAVPLKTWVRVTGVFDEEANEVRIYSGARLAATAETPKHPLVNLEAKSVPGIGIGNVQNDKGPHNQPMDGIVADLRLYGEALKPAEAGYAPLQKASEPG